MNLELANGIRLTEIRRSDQDALIEFLNNRDVNATTVRIPFPYTAADANDWFAIVETLTHENGQPLNWAIRDESDKLIGDIGLQRSGGPFSHNAEMGYWLAKPFWGRGIMTAVVTAVCQHAFENLGLARITAHVFSFNHASARVLEKCRFEQEGFVRQHYSKDGKFIDAKAYGLVQGQDSRATITPCGLTVRPYRERDEDQVVQLWQTVFPADSSWNMPTADIRRKLTVQRDLFLVGEIAGEIVATVMAGFDGNRGWVHRVAVSPRFQRRGFGQAMMIEAEKRLDAFGCTKVNLQVRSDNGTVVAFYKSLGYSVEDRISMGKRLS